MSITGKCLCEKIRFEIDAPLGAAGNCHCSMCRRFHGAAFATYAEAKPGSVRFLSGENLLNRYESSPGGFRCFCGNCGSSLFGMSKDGVAGSVYVALGCLEGDPQVRPASHLWVSSKVPWLEIHDQLPQFPEFPPSS